MSTLSIFVCTTRWSLLVWPKHVTVDILNSIYSVDERSVGFFSTELNIPLRRLPKADGLLNDVLLRSWRMQVIVWLLGLSYVCVCTAQRGPCTSYIVLFLMYSDYERWSFCARLSVCTVTTCLEWTFCMTKFHECSVTPVSYYLRHIVMIYFSPHEAMFVVGCKTITPQAVHISCRTWGEKR